MCNKCLKKTIAKEILNLEIKVDQLFGQIESEPEKIKDKDVIHFMDKIRGLIKKYEDLK